MIQTSTRNRKRRTVNPFKLNDSARAAWRFMARFQAAHGYPPTHREVAAGIGLSLTGTRYAMHRLHRAGITIHEYGLARGTRLFIWPVAERCEKCGKLLNGRYALLNDLSLCPECYTEVRWLLGLDR